MSHVVWFNVPLVCLTNQSIVAADKTRLYTSSLNPNLGDLDIALNDDLEIAIEDFEDGYFTLRTPAETEPQVRALERWGCKACAFDHWVRLQFDQVDAQHYRLSAAATVPLTPDAVRDVHFVSRWMDTWIATNRGPEVDRILDLVLPIFPPDTREKLVRTRDGSK